MPGGKIVCERKEQEQENELADKQKKKKSERNVETKEGIADLAVEKKKVVESQEWLDLKEDLP